MQLPPRCIYHKHTTSKRLEGLAATPGNTDVPPPPHGSHGTHSTPGDFKSHTTPPPDRGHPSTRRTGGEGCLLLAPFPPTTASPPVLIAQLSSALVYHFKLRPHKSTRHTQSKRDTAKEQGQRQHPPPSSSLSPNQITAAHQQHQRQHRHHHAAAPASAPFRTPSFSMSA